MQRDFFISHATEDKESVARPLALELVSRGFSVWYDEHELTLGDSLTERINEGLACCRFGVVVLSESFFKKRWPREELNGLVARSISSRRKLILPVWHNITKDSLLVHMPQIADKCAAKTEWGIDKVSTAIASALPSPDYKLRQGLLGRWRDPADNDTLYFVDQGAELGGIYDLARNHPVGVIRGVLFDNIFCYQWRWIEATMQGAGRLLHDPQTRAMSGKWWYHDDPTVKHDVRYDYIDDMCPTWLSPKQIKVLMYELFSG